MLTMKSFDIEERVNQAVHNFESGYNCAQSVFLAYSDVFELDLELAKKMSVSFGGGVGRMREVCGTVNAMAMLAGFKYPVFDPLDQEARARNYGMVQKWRLYSRRSMGRSFAVAFFLRKRHRRIPLLPHARNSIMPNVLAVNTLRKRLVSPGIC